MADYPDPQPVRLEPWLDLAPHLDGLEVVSVSLGPDRAVYVLAIQPPSQYRDRTGCFPIIRPSTPNTFVVLRCQDQQVERFVLPGQTWNFRFVQPLPDDELLLVCSRCRYRTYGDYDFNAQVVGRDGATRRSFCLGDGIEDVQTTGDGRIWVSYFDEGVLGNYGWKDPVGRHGLICWDASGRQLYAYEPPAGLDMICDCYALNSASEDDAWFYYYTEFRLVHIRGNHTVAWWGNPLGGDRVAGWWDCPIKGANGFAMDGDMLLMNSGYGNRDTYRLLELGSGHAMSELAACAFFARDGAPLADARAALRADQIVLLHENRCYRIDVAEALVRLT